MNIPTIMAQANNLTPESKPLLPFINAHYDELITQLNQCGALLLRGFACQEEHYFSEAIESFRLGTRCSTKEYSIPRTLLSNNLYTSSDLPGDVFVPLHHEKPRSKNPPNTLYFCCVTPPAQAGATLLANAAAIWLDIPKTIKDKIIEHGVVYKQFFHGNSLRYRLLKTILDPKYVLNWRDYFSTPIKTEIESLLEQQDVTWEWINNDLVVKNHLPGVRKHPITNQMCWFNSAAYINHGISPPKAVSGQNNRIRQSAFNYLISRDLFPMVCHYGNERAFSLEEIRVINQIQTDHTVAINWQQGDFLVVDNYTFMHGKQPHEGKRLLYSCMTEFKR